uniref:Uncharacterized protein n=1 Tax=Nelumbo nucifera TaxID=4432 RepID=A0A822ZDQ1_NELNU|nr:TPA_asm: hypothetical protein HUJ06_002554 [Nelumbo nucifera]
MKNRSEKRERERERENGKKTICTFIDKSTNNETRKGEKKKRKAETDRKKKPEK